MTNPSSEPSGKLGALKQRAAKLKTDVPAVFLCLKHPQTPWYAKVLAALTVAYALSPVDLIPDFIPVLGYLDDLLLLPLLCACVIKLIPCEVFEECRRKAEGMWEDGVPKKRYFAIPIVLIWLVVLYFILRAVFKQKLL